MDLRKLFFTNKSVEATGIKMFLNKEEDVWLKIARKNNPAHKAFVSKAFTENGTMLGIQNDASEALAVEILKEAASKYLLVGWNNLSWGDKENIPYSPEAALAIFKESDDFYKMVDTFAGNMSNYLDAEVAKDAKN